MALQIQDGTDAKPVVAVPSQIIQIQVATHPGDYNSGPHYTLFALCKDGSVWCQFHSSGYSNVPTDGLWYRSHMPHSTTVSNSHWSDDDSKSVAAEIALAVVRIRREDYGDLCDAITEVLDRLGVKRLQREKRT